MATTADYLTQLQADKQTLIDNLVAKGVEASNDETFTTLVPKVAEIKATDDEWDTSVDFIDFNGDLLYHYTQDEIQNMEELPLPPEHELLEFTNWNWSLEELKEWGKGMIVGAVYKTIDGASKIFVNIDEPMEIQFYGLIIENGYIDWGDGVIEEVHQTAYYEYNRHTYENSGKYVISIGGSEVRITCPTNSSSGAKLLTPTGVIYGIYIGDGHYICMMSSTQADWYNVEFIVFPETCTWDYQNGLQPQGMHKLKAIIGPKSTKGRISLYSRNGKYVSVPKYSAGIYINYAYEMERFTPAYISENSQSTGWNAISLNDIPKLKELDLAGYSISSGNTIENCNSLTKLRAENGQVTPKVTHTALSEIQLFGPPSSNQHNVLTYNNLKKVVIPNTYTKAPAVSYNKFLEEIEIMEGVTELPSNFATDCTYLKTIKGFEHIKTIASSIFSNTIFADIDISNIENLVDNAFQNMRGLKKAIFHNSITEIPKYVCYNCEALTEIKIPDGVTVINNYAFSNCAFNKVTIPPLVTTIGDSAFNSSKLFQVEFESDENLLTLGHYDFAYAKNPKLPNSVQTIGNGYYAYNSEYINIPRDCVSIGSSYCYYGKDLKEIDATLCKQVPTIGSSLFRYASKDFILKVPSSLYDEWTSATNWSAFADNIVAVEVE